MARQPQEILGTKPTDRELPEDDERLVSSVTTPVQPPGALREPERFADDEGRQDRAMNDPARDGDRATSDDERLEDFMAMFYQEALPNLPPIPGYHPFWATTTNTRDTIAMRLRMGYEFVRPEEVPGFESLVAGVGDFSGRLMVNEMVAMKLPLSLFQRYMKHVHHTLPEEEQRKLTTAVDVMREQAQRHGAEVIEEPAQRALRRHRPAPSFVGTGVDGEARRAPPTPTQEW